MNTKKKPPKNPRPKKRTAGVEVVKVKGYVFDGAMESIRNGFSCGFSPRKPPYQCVFFRATLTVHIPKRRSSK